MLYFSSDKSNSRQTDSSLKYEAGKANLTECGGKIK